MTFGLEPLRTPEPLSTVESGRFDQLRLAPGYPRGVTIFPALA